MKAKDLVEALTETDIILLLTELGAEPQKLNNYIQSKTICHGGDSRKLVYYDDKKVFTCYTGCEQPNFNIIDLVIKVKGLSFYETLLWVCNIVGITDTSFSNLTTQEDLSFLDKLKSKKYEEKKVKVYDATVLNDFKELYYEGWLEEGITYSTMKKFGIRFCSERFRIVIPNFNVQGELVGIRVRNLVRGKNNEVSKYLPLFYENNDYSFPSNSILYGVYENKCDIVKYKSAILFEGEKSVLKLHSYTSYPSIGVATYGTKISEEQIRMLRKMGVENVIIAYDKEFETGDKTMELIQAKKLRATIVDKLRNEFNVSILWDNKHNLLELKDSPVDKGEEVFKELMKNRINII
ncbi:MAG: toprim domain-containing protein [Clostridium sp.]|uniref:toprim domain-containing protein n=1 Tax=Clostridium sp. TaxID=1506 RepID=UPI003F3F488E